MNTAKQREPAPGDYYGVIYEGSIILPILVIVVLMVAFWWFLRKRKSTK